MRTLTPQQQSALLAELTRSLERDLRLNPLRFVRHPKRGIVSLRPFTKQWEFIRLYRRVSKVAGWDGPNRAGKSMAAAMIVTELLSGLPIEAWPQTPRDLSDLALGPPRRYGCITISKEKSRDGQQKALAERIPVAWLDCKPWSERTGFGSDKPVLVLRNQSTVHFLSDLQRHQSLESYEWHGAWIDEAVQPWVYDRVIGRLVDAGGKLQITCVAEAAWIYRVLRMRVMRVDALEPVSTDVVDSISDSTMFDNELIDPEDIQRSIDLWGGENSKDTRMRVYGQYVHLQGAVFGDYDDLRHVEPTELVPRGEGRHLWTIYEVLDPGYANPFAVAFVGVDQNGRRHVFDEIYERGLIVSQVAARIMEIRRKHGYERPYRAVIDSAANAAKHYGVDIVSIRRQLLECGIQTAAAEKGAGSLDAGLQRIRALLQRDLIRVQQHCKWMRFEMMNYRYPEPNQETGEYTGDREKPIDAHNHLIDALRYGEELGLTYVPHPDPIPPANTVARDLYEAKQAKARKRERVWR